MIKGFQSGQTPDDLYDLAHLAAWEQQSIIAHGLQVGHCS